MSGILKAGVAVLFSLFVLAALVFGATTVYASSMAMSECGNDPGEIGTCPPYDDPSCHFDCQVIYQTPGGECHRVDDKPGLLCCICAV